MDAPSRRTLRAGALLVALVWASATAQPLSPAQRVFNRANELLQTQYGGLSKIDRAALQREYQQRLNNVCQSAPTTCAEEKAYPVLEAEFTALDDPHSFFQVPEDYDSFLNTLMGGNRLQYGVKLAHLDGENRVVTDVIPGSAAADVGLQRGDLLLQLDGQPYTYSALRAARDEGRTIRLDFTRLGQLFHVDITARESTVQDLPRMTRVGPQRTVGLLRIPTFLSAGGVAERVHELVAQAERERLSGIIVDLRGNTGGNLSECDGAASAFVPSFSRVAASATDRVSTLVRGGKRVQAGEVLTSLKAPQLWQGPMAVLVDELSASCSEFFAYEVQYAGRGPVIGEQTAGVGNTATRVFDLGDAAVQLTVLHYLKAGEQAYPAAITPDRLLPQSEENVRLLTQGKDTLLEAALQALSVSPKIRSVY